MDIKEIALKVAEESGAVGYSPAPLRAVRGYSFTYEQLQKFAEAFISAYKAELLKEAGEPVNACPVGVALNAVSHVGAANYDHREREARRWIYEAEKQLFTPDQVSAAILKATKSLEDQLTKAEQLWQVAQGRCDGLEEKLAKAEQRVAEWQPIDTAPKDEVILVSHGNGVWMAKHKAVFLSGYVPDNPWFSVMLNKDHIPAKKRKGYPTHWMPLPKAPANGASS